MKNPSRLYEKINNTSYTAKSSCVTGDNFDNSSYLLQDDFSTRAGDSASSLELVNINFSR